MRAVPGLVVSRPTDVAGAGAGARRSDTPARPVLCYGEVSVRTAPGTGGHQPAQSELLQAELDGEAGRGGEGEVAGEGQGVTARPGHPQGLPGAGRPRVRLVTG